MLAPTSSSPPKGMTRRTLRDRVALELPVALAIERAGVTGAGRAACRLEPDRADVNGRAGLRPPGRGTRRGLGFAIIDCFQEFRVRRQNCVMLLLTIPEYALKIMRNTKNFYLLICIKGWGKWLPGPPFASQLPNGGLRGVRSHKQPFENW